VVGIEHFPHQPFNLPHQSFGNCKCPISVLPLMLNSTYCTVTGGESGPRSAPRDRAWCHQSHHFTKSSEWEIFYYFG